MIDRRRRHREDDDAKVDITPMLDVVFILLIFFIVSTSFVKEFGVDMNRPSNAPTKERERAEVIAVRIDAASRIFVDDRAVEPDAVRANIENGLARNPQASVVVVADRAADAGAMVRVVDQARVAGAPSVSLAAAAQ